MMKRTVAICALLLSAPPALAMPQCEDALARLTSADQRVIAVERYGRGGYWEQTERGRVAYFLHAWAVREAGATRYIILTEIPGTSGPNWGSVAEPHELKAKFDWWHLDAVELDDVIRIHGGPLEGEWTLACQGRPPRFVKLPRFADYPATGPAFRGSVKKPVVPRRIHENVRLKLLDAFAADAQKPNAGKRYLLLKWACGTACVGGALVDAPTGRVIWLPHMSDWGDVGDDFEPFDVRLSSRLVVLSGLRNERGLFGRHFYVLKHGRLRHLRSVETEHSFPQKVE
jgi:hypothetical protein